MSAVKQEFSASGDDRVANAYRKIAAENEALLRSNEKLTKETQTLSDQVKKMAADLESLTGRRMQQLDAEIRKTQELKRARQELIVTNNWVYARPQSGGIIPTTNWTTASPPPDPEVLRLKYRGDATRDLVAGARHPSFTMEEGDVPRLGYRYGLGALSVMPRSLQQSQSHMKAIDGLAGAVFSKATAIAGAWLTVSTAIRGVNAELEITKRIQQGAAREGADVALGQAEILLNTSDPADQKKFLAAQKELALKYGVNPRLVGQTLGRQSGRASNLSAEQIIAASEEATALGRVTPDQIKPMASAIQQTMVLTGKDAKWASALMSKAGEAAFPGDPELQFRMLFQGMSAMAANVPSPTARTIEQQSEVISALSKAGGEERGSEAATAGANLQARIAEFIEQRGPWQKTSPYSGRVMRLKPRDLPYDPIDFLGRLRNDPATAQKFWDKFTAEQHYEGIIRSFQDPNSKASNILAEAQQQISPDLKALERKKFTLAQGTPELANANLANQADVANRLGLASLKEQAVLNSLTKSRDDALDLFGESGGRWLVSKGLRAGSVISDTTSWMFGGRPESRVAELREMRDEFRSPWYGRRFGLRDPESLSARDQEIYTKLDALVRNAEEQVRLLREQNNKAPSAGPAMNGQFGRSNER